VHKALADRLTPAETAMVTGSKINPDRKSAKDFGVALKMYASTSDLRQPAKAVGGGGPSMNTFGLAVDLNYKGNLFIGNAGAEVCSTVSADVDRGFPALERMKRASWSPWFGRDAHTN
jgi:hypothetical protein